VGRHFRAAYFEVSFPTRWAPTLVASFFRDSHSGVALLRTGLMVGLLFSQYALHEFGAEPLLCSGQQLAAKVCEEFAGCPMTLVTEFICNVDLLVPQSLCGYDLWIGPPGRCVKARVSASRCCEKASDLEVHWFCISW